MLVIQIYSQKSCGAGGIDNYTNAISDIYQDNFQEGIFTGKEYMMLKYFQKY